MASDQSGDDTDRWVCLDLFAGLGGFSAAFEDSDEWEVVTVDLEERFDPDIQADVMNIRPEDLPDADVVLASPPCKTFSKAAAWHGHYSTDAAPQTDEAREAVALVFHTIGLIRALDSDYWFIENPEGHLRKFLGHPTGSVTYCQYGAEYMKPTDLWGDSPPMDYRRCRNGDDCHRRSRSSQEKGDGEHPSDALPRNPAERAKVPYQLSESIRDACEAALDGDVAEQATFAEVREA
jgi:hypothetical protein